MDREQRQELVPIIFLKCLLLLMCKNLRDLVKGMHSEEVSISEGSCQKWRIRRGQQRSKQRASERIREEKVMT